MAIVIAFVKAIVMNNIVAVAYDIVVVGTVIDIAVEATVAMLIGVRIVIILVIIKRILGIVKLLFYVFVIIVWVPVFGQTRSLPNGFLVVQLCLYSMCTNKVW
jgi:hypothetical protein